MTKPDATHAGRNTALGLLLGLGGFTMLTVGDGLVKSTAGQWPGLGVAALRYAFGALGLAAVIVWTRGRSGFRVARPGLQFARGLAVGIATLGFFSGIQLMPLADATAIQFTAPIFAALFSRLLLHERAPASVWLTTLMAMAGVAMVLRPNLLALGPAALLPVMSATALGLLMVLNRLAAGSGNAVALQFWLAMGAVPLLAAAMAAGHLSGIAALHLTMPSSSVVLKCAAVAVTGTAAHWLIFDATRYAPAPVVAPTIYVQLVLAGSIGWLVFGDVIDPLGAVGMALIIGSTLNLWYAQRRLERRVPR